MGIRLEYAHEQVRYKVCFTIDGQKALGGEGREFGFDDRGEAITACDQLNEEAAEGHWVIVEERVIFSRVVI